MDVKSISETDLMKLEKRLIKQHAKELNAYMFYKKSAGKMLLMEFLEGTARGLGFIVGTAIIVAIFGITLTKVLANVPVVGDFFESVGIWIEQTNPEASKL